MTGIVVSVTPHSYRALEPGIPVTVRSLTGDPASLLLGTGRAAA